MSDSSSAVSDLGVERGTVSKFAADLMLLNCGIND